MPRNHGGGDREKRIAPPGETNLISERRKDAVRGGTARRFNPMKSKKSTATSKLADLVKGVAAKITKTAAKAVPRQAKKKGAAKSSAAKVQASSPEPEVKPAPPARKLARTVIPELKPAAAPKKAARKTARKAAAKEVELPPILFEGDRPSLPPAGGPGQRYALGPAAPKEDFADEVELPDAYGT
jgi:hypothetical protein